MTRYCPDCGSQFLNSCPTEEITYEWCESCGGTGPFIDYPPSNPPKAHLGLDLTTAELYRSDVDTARLNADECLAEELEEAAELEDERRRLGMWG